MKFLLSPQDMNAHYRKINRLAFGGRLPKATVMFLAMSPLGRTWRTRKDGWMIAINERSQWNENECVLTLIHEMVHIAVPRQPHGREFGKLVCAIALKARRWEIF